MKKICSLFLLALLSVVTSLTASAAKIVVDDASHVKVTYYDYNVSYEQQTLVFTDNEATIATSISYNVTPVAPYVLKSVTSSDGNSPYFEPSSVSIYAYNEDVTYTITTYDLEASRTASFTLNIDEASLAYASFPATRSNLTLQNGTQTVKFNPETETTLSIGSANYQKPIYQVKLNGENVSGSGGYYSVPLTDGCVVDITAKMPELPATVTFEYDEKGLGCLSSVKLDNVVVEDFNGTSLSTVTGTLLTLTPNLAYKFDSFYVNGESVYWSGTYDYTMTVTADTRITINAHPYGTVKATLKVDDPANVLFYNASYPGSGSQLDITATETELEFSENNTTLSWKAAAMCYIDKVIVDGVPYTYESLSITDGMVIEVTTGRYVADQTLVVWMDNRDIALDYFSFVSQTERTEFPISTGYNIIEYYQALSPFGLSWYSSTGIVADPHIYVNDEEISPMYQGSTSYQFGPENNSVVKIFLTTQPEECTVVVANEQQLPVSIKRDIVVPVEAAETQCFAGTKFEIKPEGDTLIEVAVNQTKVEADENGAFVFTVTEPQTAVAITADNSSAITEIGTDAVNADSDVFNLQGIKVGTAADLDRLPAGVYITAGKKVLVK